MTGSPSRPLPTPSALTEPFWRAAREHVLVRPVCGACGRSFFTPQVICPHCLGEEWAYEPSSGRGTIYSTTVVHRPPSKGLDVPYELAIVDIEERWTMLATIINDSPTSTPIGTAVEVAWVTVDDEITLPAFRVATVEENR